MATKIKSLENYTKTLVSIAEFQKKHGKVFQEYDALQVQLSEATEELKKDVKENHKMNIANEFVRVSFSPAYSKGYSFEKLAEILTPKQIKQLRETGAIVTTEKVDTDKVDEAVELGVIPVEARQKAYEETELSPRVSIKEIT